MASVHRLAPGTLIGGEYKIRGLLAKGGMGAVYVAEQLSTECDRALKVMHPELLDDAKSRERFKQEARICARIESDHVVKVIGSGIDEALGAPWLAMELIKGEDLQTFFIARAPLPRPEALEVFRQMCHGLGAAHKMGVVHRDLKLQNILVATATRSDSPFTVKVLDFGASKLIKDDATSDTTAALGSPMWMAPEQAYKGKIGASTDIWPLGLIAFRALTGCNYWLAANKAHPPIKEVLFEVLMSPLPFASDRARELGVPKLPKGFNAWFARAVVRDPAGRFKDATEALAALVPVLSTLEDEAPTRALSRSERETAPQRPGAKTSPENSPSSFRPAASVPSEGLASERPAAAQDSEAKEGDYVLPHNRDSGVGWALDGGVAPVIQAPTPSPSPRIRGWMYLALGVLLGALLGTAWLLSSRAGH